MGALGTEPGSSETCLANHLSSLVGMLIIPVLGSRHSQILLDLCSVRDLTQRISDIWEMNEWFMFATHRTGVWEPRTNVIQFPESSWLVNCEVGG